MTDRSRRPGGAWGAGPARPAAALPGFSLLRDLISQHTGIYYSDAKRDLLEDRVGEIVAARGLPSLLDYYYLLRYDPDADAVWAELRDRLAVPETYFWRQADQFEVLVREVLPRLPAGPGAGAVRIWSAACCSGEEPLSIAMALDEGGWFDRLSIDVVGSDASPALVARARAGLFGERSLRALSAERRERYFTREGAQWRIDPALHARVRWATANLMDPAEVAPLACAEVVFCRNVFIYFSDEAVEAVVGTFAEHMPSPGYLFLGASESLMRLTTDFVMDELGSTFVYMKRPDLPPGPDAAARRRASPAPDRS